MSRSKKLLLLLGVLAAVCVVTFCVSRYQEHQEQIKTSDQIILEIPEDSVTALSWTYDGQSLAFHRDEVWYYDAEETFPVDEDAISALLEGFQSFGVSFIIEEVEDYGQYGLDDPVCTIRLTAGEDQYEIQLGDFSTLDAQRYVSIGDGNVYLVQEDPLDAFDVELSDLIDNDSLPYVGTADQISAEGEDPLRITWQEESSSYREEDHYFVTVDGEAQPLDTGLVEDFLYTLSSLDLTEYMTYNAGEDDLATYGLDDPERTITLDYTTQDEDGNETAHTVSLAVSRAPAERWDDTQADAETGGGHRLRPGGRVPHHLQDHHPGIPGPDGRLLRHPAAQGDPARRPGECVPGGRDPGRHLLYRHRQRRGGGADLVLRGAGAGDQRPARCPPGPDRRQLYRGGAHRTGGDLLHPPPVPGGGAHRKHPVLSL